jgi:hypothetical protein
MMGPRFVFTPNYGGCTYNGVGVTITRVNCEYRLKLPIPFTGNEWRTTLDVIGTGCEIKQALEPGCQVKIVSGASYEDLSTVFEEDVAGGFRAIIVVPMSYSSAGCNPPIEATGRTVYRQETTFLGTSVVR